MNSAVTASDDVEQGEDEHGETDTLRDEAECSSSPSTARSQQQPMTPSISDRDVMAIIGSDDRKAALLLRTAAAEAAETTITR